MADSLKVTEISVRSEVSFDDAVKEGMKLAVRRLRGVTGAWVKDQRIEMQNDRIVAYQVNLMVSYVLELK